VKFDQALQERILIAYIFSNAYVMLFSEWISAFSMLKVIFICKIRI